MLNIWVCYIWFGDGMDYRQRIREVREDRDFTQKQIGAVINKSQQGYNHIEDGRSELKIDDLIKLLKFYNLGIEYLSGVSDIETKFYKDKKEKK